MKNKLLMTENLNGFTRNADGSYVNADGVKMRQEDLPDPDPLLMSKVT